VVNRRAVIPFIFDGMSEYLKIETGKSYFITFTVVDWLDVFLREEYANILIESIKYCQKEKGLEVYAYCIMPNHVHMIASAGEGNLSDVLRDMKGHTSKRIVKAIAENRRESKRELFLERFRNAADQSKRHKHYCFWRETNHPVELYSDKFIMQKENYIHMNPVKMGLVSRPEHYRLSSASEESPIKIIRWK
jgi:putative transposase